MPRTARIHAPGHLTHIIARLVNREHRISDDEVRAEYLRRIARSLTRCDWALLAYVLMETHLHVAAIAGNCSAAAFLHPVHSGFAGWLNRRDRRLGPVFAERYYMGYVPKSRAAALIAYVHNNPVRASLVGSAVESTWSSHRAYAAAVRAPEWLKTSTGLGLCGFANTRSDRAAFDHMVDARALAPREPSLVADASARARVQARADAGGPVEVGSPALERDGARFPILAHPETSCAPASGSLDPWEALRHVSRATGLTLEQVCSRQKTRAVCNARSLAITLWDILGQPRAVMARALGVTGSAATRAAQRQSDSAAAVKQRAAEIASLLLDGREQQ